MKTSGKFILGLIVIVSGLAILSAVLFFRYMTNSQDKRDITKYYTSYNIDKCNTVVVDGSISVTIEKNDTVGITMVKIPATSKDTVMITISGNTLQISSTDTSGNKTIPEVKLNLSGIQALLTHKHAQLYIHKFPDRNIIANAMNESYIGLNGVSADSLKLEVFDKAKIRAENGVSGVVSAILHDHSKAELSFPIECDSALNTHRELHLRLLDKSFLNIWGSYGSLDIRRDPDAVLEVYNITNNVKNCGQSDKEESGITVKADVSQTP